MSATVSKLKAGHDYSSEKIVVPNVTRASVNRDGHLQLQAVQYGDVLAVFKEWDYYVIDPPALRGPGGRFIKKEQQ